MTPTPIGQYLGGSYPFTITTTADAPAGGSIVLMCGGAGPPGVGHTITDSAGNTYTISATDNLGWYSFAIASNIVHLPLGGTITVPDQGGATHAWCQAFYVDAVLTNDVFGTGNAVGAPVTTPTLAVQPEFVVGMSHVYPGGGGSITPPAGWTTPLAGTVTGTGSLLAEIDYKVVTSTNPVTYAPTMFGFHAPTYLNIFTFKPFVPPVAGGRAMVTWF